MKKLVLRIAVLLLALCVLMTSVLAAEGFNAGLTIEKKENTISVTVVHSDVFQTETARLTIPTGMDWEWAKVTFDGKELEGVTWNADEKSVTFPVAKGGTYVIAQAESPSGEEPPTEAPSVPSNPQKPNKPETPKVPVMAFSDVSTGDWFYDDVKFVYEQGLMNGVGGGSFAPHEAMTRGMVVQILYNLAGKPAAGKECFHDVAPEDWYHDAVAWAASNGIADGVGNGSFAPQSAVTREQLAVMLLRYAVAQGLDAVSLAEHLDGFADGGAVSDWAVSAMNWAVGTGLINGMDGKLAPQSGATRAQTAAILARFCK